MPNAGELRQRIRIERRAGGSNVGGVVKGSWATLIETRAAKLIPSRSGAGETVMAGRLAGRAPWDCWIRWDSETREIRTNDRAVEIGTDRTFNIRSCLNMDGKRTWLFLQLEEGVANG